MAGSSGIQSGAPLLLTSRRQRARATGRAGWQVIEEVVSWQPSETAVLVVDMWDNHWSYGASERAAVLAPRIDTVVRFARERGLLIIHAPSDVVDFYRGHPAREWVLALPSVEPPPLQSHIDPPLPVSAPDHATFSDTGETSWYEAWTRQHPAIGIQPQDAVSADGDEVYGILLHRGIRNIVVMGVHANMCVLNRSFAIKNLVRWGFSVVLARDLTDAMYNPLTPPYVSHDEGTQLVIAYIEKFWCPTITSDDLTGERIASAS